MDSKGPTQLHKNWSQNNHYCFGYNGESFNYRKSIDDFYMVRYNDPALTSRTLKEEIIQSLLAFYKENGPLSIPGHGGVFSQIAIAACREAQLPFRVLQLSIEALHCCWPKYEDVKYEHVSLGRVELQKFFGYFREFAPCVDARIMFNACAGYQSEFAHVYDTHIGLQFTDFNFDSVQDKFVGPANWCLVDAEKRTATCRFLDALDRPGLVDFFHHSPQLMRAYLLHPQFLWLIQSNRNPRQADNFTNHNAILRQSFPHSSFAIEFEALNPELTTWLRHQEAAMSEQSRGNCTDLWATPLDFFIRNWKLTLEPKSPEEAYGCLL